MTTIIVTKGRTSTMKLRPLCLGLIAAPLLLTWTTAHAALEDPYLGNPVQGGTITLNAVCAGDESLGGQPDPTWTIEWFPDGVTTGTPNGSVTGPTTYDTVTDIVTGSLVIPIDAPLGDTYVARWGCFQYVDEDEGTYRPTSVFTIGSAAPTTTTTTTTTAQPTVTTAPTAPTTAPAVAPVVTQPTLSPSLSPTLPSTGSSSRSVWAVGMVALTAGALARLVARRPRNAMTDRVG